MGGDHGNVKTTFPDYRMWKWEGTPLEVTQQRLARRGLKDPWARNEAWRYSSIYGKPKTFFHVVKRGFVGGFIACAVCLAVEYTFFPPEKSDH
ncbi:NADH dehydrogenase [ubiquinone] 1 beta subcomplex subunit 3 [Salminus brasiliensis]|uniref:NADH dehydrogenase [ubiquinone] 1 beta subcomplex subunit 3 n=1 Tax=Salminus brasiliensis TaxID=930266 RepID=UPI003B82CDDA